MVNRFYTNWKTQGEKILKELGERVVNTKDMVLLQQSSQAAEEGALRDDREGE